MAYEPSKKNWVGPEVFWIWGKKSPFSYSESNLGHSARSQSLLTKPPNQSCLCLCLYLSTMLWKYIGGSWYSINLYLLLMSALFSGGWLFHAPACLSLGRSPVLIIFVFDFRETYILFNNNFQYSVGSIINICSLVLQRKKNMIFPWSCSLLYYA